MILNRLFIAILFIAILIVIDRLEIQFRIPGFSYIQNLYLYEKDICKVDALEEIEKISKSLKDMFDFQWYRFNSALTHAVSALSDVQINKVKYKSILGKVTSIPQDVFPEQMFVDVGKLHGVRKYSLVIKDGFIFGRVIDVWDKSSKILTIFSDDFYIDVVLPDGTRAILRGNYDGNLKIFLSLSEASTFQSGLTIFSAGDRYSSPFGLRVGFINQEGMIRSPVNLKDLVFVTILSPED